MTAPVMAPPAPGGVALPRRGRGPRRRTTLARRRTRLGLLMVAPAAIMLGLFFLWPLTQTVRMSFYDWPMLGEHTWVGLQNYTDALGDEDFLAAVGFTLKYTLIATPLLFAVALLLALLVRRGTRAARGFQTIFFIPVVVGMAAASYVWMYMFQPDLGPASALGERAGLLDASQNSFATFTSALVIVLGMVTWKVVGLQMLLLSSGLQSIPVEVNEAARIDGAGRWQAFRHITLPLLRPTLALVLVFSVAGSLLAFDQFFIMTAGGPSNSTITAVFQTYRTSFIQFELGAGAAMSVLLMVALAAVSALQMLLLRNTDNA
jgi:multiple sugar transport system permease protein